MNVQRTRCSGRRYAPPLYLVAILTLDSMAAVQAALTSSEGVAKAADLGNFAQAGVELLMFDTREV